jgi:hypothetical protein
MVSPNASDAGAPAANPAPRAAASAHGLDPDTAQLGGWLGLALVNAVFLARLSMPTEGVGIRALHHLYDAGQLIGAGLVTATVVWAWRRGGPKRAAWGYLALTAAAIAVGSSTLVDDVSGPASDLGGDKWSGVWTAALVTAVSLGVPAAAIAGRVLALRPWLRPIGVAGAIGAAVANHLILLNDYPGAHLYLAWAAATLGGASMTDARLGKPDAAPSRLEQRIGWGVRAVLTAVAAYTFLVWPRQSVVVQLGRLQGAVLMPLVARRHQHAAVRAAAIAPEAMEWFADRSKAPDVPASSPPLVPANAVVVFLTIDAFRADVLDKEENLRQLPRIRELISRSVWFTQARTPGVSTRNSLAALFTGKYHSQLHWSNDKRKGSNLAGDHTPRFTELLDKAGVSTFKIVSYPPLGNQVGLASGFTEQLYGPKIRGQEFPLSEQMTNEAIARLERHGDGPLLIYMHFMDPHDPYDAAGVKATPYESYVAEIGLCDASIGRILDTLERRKLLDRAVLIVSADHGEGLGQHETPHHGLTLYEELVHVPLIIHTPGVVARRVDDNVSLLDVGPTILDLMRLPTPGSSMGQSLTPYLRGQNPRLLRPIVADTGNMRSILLGRIKVIQNDYKGSEEIYDLSTDPGETHNLFDSMGDTAADRMSVLQTFFEAHRLRAPKRGRATQDVQ